MNAKQIFTALAVLIVLVMASCKTSAKDVLVRKWKIVDATGPMLTPEVKAQYTADGNTLEFREDGSYVAWSKGKKDDSGSYTLSEDGKTLVTKTAKNGPNRTSILKELTKDRLIINIGTLDIIFEPSK